MHPNPIGASLMQVEPVLSEIGHSPDTCQLHGRTDMCRLRDFSWNRFVKVGAIALRVHVMIMSSSITAYFPKLSNMTVTNKLDMTVILSLELLD